MAGYRAVGDGFQRVLYTLGEGVCLAGYVQYGCGAGGDGAESAGSDGAGSAGAGSDGVSRADTVSAASGAAKTPAVV